MEDYERSGIVVAVFSYLSCNHSDAPSPNIYIHSTDKQPAESHQSMQASWSDTLPTKTYAPCSDLIDLPAPYNAVFFTLCQNAYMHGGWLYKAASLKV